MAQKKPGLPLATRFSIAARLSTFIGTHGFPSLPLSRFGFTLIFSHAAY